jgi:hypothetical protein
MDPAEILTVRFHYGGEFVRIGPTMDYVGGDEAISEIERDKISLQEVKGFLKDHIPELKDAMKFYYLMPGKELADGLLFLYNDESCIKMSNDTTEGGVADIFVEYQGGEDDDGESSGSDFEDEIFSLVDSSETEVPQVITAEDYDSAPTVAAGQIEQVAILDNVLVLDDSGVITQVQSSPGEKISGITSPRQNFQRRERESSSQVMAGTSQVINPIQRCQDLVLIDDTNTEEGSESEEDSDYVPHSDDSGEESEVVQLRKKANQFLAIFIQ